MKKNDARCLEPAGSGPRPAHHSAPVAAAALLLLRQPRRLACPRQARDDRRVVVIKGEVSAREDLTVAGRIDGKSKCAITSCASAARRKWSPRFRASVLVEGTVRGTSPPPSASSCSSTAASTATLRRRDCHGRRAEFRGKIDMPSGAATSRRAPSGQPSLSRQLFRPPTAQESSARQDAGRALRPASPACQSPCRQSRAQPAADAVCATASHGCRCR